MPPSPSVLAIRCTICMPWTVTLIYLPRECLRTTSINRSCLRSISAHKISGPVATIWNGRWSWLGPKPFSCDRTAIRVLCQTDACIGLKSHRRTIYQGPKWISRDFRGICAVAISSETSPKIYSRFSGSDRLKFTLPSRAFTGPLSSPWIARGRGASKSAIRMHSRPIWIALWKRVEEWNFIAYCMDFPKRRQLCHNNGSREGCDIIGSLAQKDRGFVEHCAANNH